MIKAQDRFQNTISIDNAIREEQYFCPICHQLLVQKHGEIRRPHFAHYGVKKGYSPCHDNWSYDETDWRGDWLKRFPEDCYEQVVEYEGEKHFADVLIGNTVIEFQQNSISLKEFETKNAFFAKCGYKVIWVFNVKEESDCEKILETSCNGYKWSHPKKLFREINSKDIPATMYFQIDDSENSEEGVLEKVAEIADNGTEICTHRDSILSISEFISLASKEDKKVYKSEYKKTEVPISVPDGKTIYQLWQHEFSWMIVKNLVTDDTMAIKGENGEMYSKYVNWQRKVKGRYSRIGINGKYIYSKKLYIIWDDDKAVWKLISKCVDEERAKREREEAEKRRIEEEIRRKKEEEERIRREKAFEERQKLEEEKRKQWEEDKKKSREERIKELQEREEIRWKEELKNFNENLENNIAQQEKPVIDLYGNRIVKCKFCGKIAKTSAFYSYGGAGEMNLGTCYDCRKNNPAVLENLYKEKPKETSAVENIKADDTICPICGGKLKERYGSRGSFIGCSNYPNCKYTRNK